MLILQLPGTPPHDLACRPDAVEVWLLFRACNPLNSDLASWMPRIRSRQSRPSTRQPQSFAAADMSLERARSRRRSGGKVNRQH